MVEKKLKLAAGRVVPLEDGRPWPVDGVAVPVTHYIRRRLAAGDLIEVGQRTAAAEAPAIKPAPAPTDAPEIEDTAPKAVKTGGK